jgi:hypothetical protein
MAIRIKRFDDSDALPLYHRYPQQTGPQPAYLEIDPEADPEAHQPALHADWDSEIGGAVPMNVGHGRRLRVAVNCRLNVGEINALLSQIAPLVERVIDGYSCEWDGSNRVGRLDDDAEDAMGDIRIACESCEPSGVPAAWDPGDWIADCSLTDLIEPGQSLDAAAEALEVTAEADHVYLDGDLAAALRYKVAHDARSHECHTCGRALDPPPDPADWGAWVRTDHLCDECTAEEV